jgi:hypothetical protein
MGPSCSDDVGVHSSGGETDETANGVQPRGRPPAIPCWLNLVAQDLKSLQLDSAKLTSPLFTQQPAKWKQNLKERLFLFLAQPQWRQRMNEKEHLTTFSDAVPDVTYEDREFDVARVNEEDETEYVRVKVRKKMSTFAPFLLDPHRRRRQFLLTFRAAGLPLQQSCASQSQLLDFHRRGGRESVLGNSCPLCMQGNEGYAHFVNFCPAYRSMKSAFPDWQNGSAPLSIPDIILYPVRYKAQFDVLFRMWSHRQQVWRKSVPATDRKTIRFI